MAWFEDLSPCDYLGIEFAPVLRSIGWLERDRSFVTGAIDRSVYDKLVELLKDPWQPAAFMGCHGCDLCQFEPEAEAANNLFIPANGLLYICPKLILHYINAHGYAPPGEFCEAILA